MTDSSSPSLTTLDAYLAGRRQLIAGREVLFTATRQYLRPGQQPDAQLLGDPLWDSPARHIAEAEWVVNAARGYLVVLENPDKGRTFRLSALQQGHELRVGVKLPPWFSDPDLPAVMQLLCTFGDHTPVTPLLASDELQVTWHFNAERLFIEPQAMEDAVHRIGSVFESALQCFTSHSLKAS